MNRFFLRFHNQSLEKLYHKETAPIIIEKLYQFFKIQIVIMIIMGIDFLSIQEYDWQSIISLISSLGFFAFFFLLKFFLKHFFKYILIICFAGLGTLYIELIGFTEQDNGDFSEISLVLCLSLQVYITMILLTHMNWIMKTGICVFNLVYFVIRLLQFQESTYRPINISILIIISLNYAILSYTTEKSYRNQFKSIKEYNESQNHFKSLLQNIFPSPIFIINYETNQVEFFNKSASKMLYGQTTHQEIERVPNDPNENSDRFISKNVLLEEVELLVDSFQIMEEKSFGNGQKISAILKNYNMELHKKPSTVLNFESKGNFQEFKKFRISNHHKSAQNYVDECSLAEFYELQIGHIKWESKKCLIAIFNNITTTKRIIELQNLDKYKDQMLATVSHDLRTPLNGVIGMVNDVLSKVSDEENRRNLEIALRSANLLKFLINDILDFTQINCQKIRLNMEVINLRELVGEVADLMSYQFKKKGLNFFHEIINFTKGKDVFVSDSNRIKQILVNLLSNALKFTFLGFVKIKAEIRNHEEMEKTPILVHFSVQDTGIGIKEEDKPKLFRLFGKLDQEDPQINKNGIGLGLSISNNLAKILNNGSQIKDQIQVESEFGKGSKFFFTIHGGIGEAEDFSGTSTSEHKINRTLAKMVSRGNENSNEHINLKHIGSELRIDKIFRKEELTILIVEDDLINIAVLELYLKSFGISYITAVNGLNALNMVEDNVIKKNQEISLILMDCNMPIMNGYTASEQINGLLKRNHKEAIPIVAATANSAKAEIELCLNSGMKYYLEKPIQKKDLGLFLQNMFKITLKF